MLSAESLLPTLDASPGCGPLYVAFSGGLDSQVLLHLLHSFRNRLSRPVRAIHVNHGLHPDAASWATYCRACCDELEINCSILAINETCAQGESIEAWARMHRYRLFQEEMLDDGTLLTAHHRDDQVETLFLQLLRGAGPAGLAAMPQSKRLGKGWHFRPLLQYNRAQIREYAETSRLSWIQDDSNLNERFDRNYLRKTILPLLSERWPGLDKTITRVASHQAEAAAILDQLARDDLGTCMSGTKNVLEVQGLLKLDKERCANLLRLWLKSLCASVPDTMTIKRIQHELLSEDTGRNPMLIFDTHEIRRFKNRLYLLRPWNKPVQGRTLRWNLATDFPLDGEVLSAKLSKGVGIRTDLLETDLLEIRYRRGGESIQLPGKKHRQSVKKLFQEKQFPPWLRERIPFLYLQDRLVAVAGLFVDKSACSARDDMSWHIQWSGLEQYSTDKDNDELS